MVKKRQIRVVITVAIKGHIRVFMTVGKIGAD